MISPMQEKQLEIIKMEMPLILNAMGNEVGSVRISNRDKSYEAELPLTERIRLLMENKPTAYFEMSIKDGAIEALVPIEMQDPW